MEGSELATHYAVSNKEISLDELQGEAEFIAKHKVKEAAKHVTTPAITEDVSLCFNALKGLPGPYM
jgi:inosine/xanthosine triphosphate pyrophosphatase family protein